MSEQVENEGGNTQADSTTAGPTIPKWRLDEIAARLRSAQEELAVKDQLLNQFRPRAAEPQGPSAEDLGLDEQTVKSVSRLANHIADQKLKAAAAPLQHQMAAMANKMEETQFLLNHGKDKSKYLDKIKEQRQRHFQITGGYIGVEDAYKLVMFDELTRTTAAKPAAGQTQTAQATEPAQTDSGVPDSAQTKATGAAGATATKTFAEMTFEEKEAYLDRQLVGTTL